MNKNISIKTVFAHLLAANFIIMLGLAALANPVHALGGSGASSGGTLFTNPIDSNDLSGFLSKLLQVVTTIGAIVVVFFIILAGFKYVTARGDEKQISSATKTLTWTAVGAAVILGAQVISRAIQGTVNQLGE